MAFLRKCMKFNVRSAEKLYNYVSQQLMLFCKLSFDTLARLANFIHYIPEDAASKFIS